MRFNQRLLCVALLTAGVFIFANNVRAQDMHAGHDMSGHTAMNTSKALPQEAESDAVMARMHQNMGQPYTGDADADFIRGMIPHHQGAIEMAQIVLKYGDDEQAKTLARQVIKAQKGEIALMRRWLAARQIPETGPYRIK